MSYKNIYTLAPLHKREAFHFEVIDPKGVLFNKFNVPDCREILVRNNLIPLKEKFTDLYGVVLDDFLLEYDVFVCYGGVKDLFSERAVLALKDVLKGEIVFIPCSIRGQKVPLYAALFLNSAPLLLDSPGMGLDFVKGASFDVDFAIQDSNLCVRFFTEEFVNLTKQHRLRIPFSKHEFSF